MPVVGHGKGTEKHRATETDSNTEGSDYVSTVISGELQTSLSNCFKYPWQEKSLRTKCVRV